MWNCKETAKEVACPAVSGKNVAGFGKAGVQFKIKGAVLVLETPSVSLSSFPPSGSVNVLDLKEKPKETSFGFTASKY